MASLIFLEFCFVIVFKAEIRTAPLLYLFYYVTAHNASKKFFFYQKPEVCRTMPPKSGESAKSGGIKSGGIKSGGVRDVKSGGR
jgi:hypothetical protein